MPCAFCCCCAQRRRCGRRLRHLLQCGAAQGLRGAQGRRARRRRGRAVRLRVDEPAEHPPDRAAGGRRAQADASGGGGRRPLLGAADEGARRADVRAEPRRRRPVPHRRRHGQRGVVRRPRPGDRGRRAARRLRDHPVRQHVLARRAAQFGAQFGRRAIPPRNSAAHFSDGLSATASAGTSTGARRRTTRSGRAKTLPSRSTSSTTRRSRRSSAASSPPCWSARTRGPAGSTRTSRRSSRGRRGTSSSTCGTAPRNSAQFGCAILRNYSETPPSTGTAPSRACRRRRSGPRAWRRTCARTAPSSSSWTARSSRRRRCRSPGSTSSAARAPRRRRRRRRLTRAPRRLTPPPRFGRRRYYNLPASALENDLALVETWNEQEGATPKLFVVKEFGLVSSVTSDPNHNRTLAVPQTNDSAVT